MTFLLVLMVFTSFSAIADGAIQSEVGLQARAINHESVNSDQGCSVLHLEVPILHEVDGVAYAPNSDEPFTGKFISHHKNNHRKEQGCYVDGKRDGRFREWKTVNGREHLISVISYKHGVKDGFWHYVACNDRHCIKSWSGEYVNGKKIIKVIRMLSGGRDNETSMSGNVGDRGKKFIDLTPEF